MKINHSLTKAEEEIMQILWSLDRAFVKEMLALMPEPKPAYNTVSTIVRILEEKGMVDHEAFGKSHRYFPLLSKEDYRKKETGSLVKNYFNGSIKELVSYFIDDKKLNISDLDELMKSIKNAQK